jgi:hypothetical protein
MLQNIYMQICSFISLYTYKAQASVEFRWAWRQSVESRSTLDSVWQHHDNKLLEADLAILKILKYANGRSVF